jgi:hypothetical protein
MARNKDMDPDNHDDQHVYRVQANNPLDASTSLAQLITLKQQGSLGEGARHIMRYISPCFM